MVLVVREGRIGVAAVSDEDRVFGDERLQDFGVVGAVRS